MRNRDREPQTKIRATCPACGEVELTPPDVELHVCTAAERSYYAFVCSTSTCSWRGRTGGRAWSPRAADAGRPVGSGGPSPGRSALPAYLAILLGLFWLGVLVTLGFTAWRLIGNLKSLSDSVARLNQRLAPTLEELAAKSEEAAERAEKLQARGQRGGRPDHR